MKEDEEAYSAKEVAWRVIVGLILATIIGVIGTYITFMIMGPCMQGWDCIGVGLLLLFGAPISGLVGGLIGSIVGFRFKRIILGAIIGGALASLVFTILARL